MIWEKAIKCETCPVLMLYCSEFNKSNIIQDHKCLLIFIIYVYGLDVIMGGHPYTFCIQVRYAINSRILHES